ncbi:DMT family transporter [Leifsonia sp. AG29]|uniref:DMT family transporter n=1 Tax=Leifsonia sp. AG29 TaxID=2598860 RepID=UPI001E571A2C|nr:DMT family transporter [Leifsonia sp. AG29]
MRPEFFVDALLIGVAMVWGGSFLAAKDLTAAVGVPATLALRFLVAAVALGLVVLFRREQLPRGRALVVALGLGLSQAAVIALETAGVHGTSATNAGVLISLSLILTPFLEGLASRTWLPAQYFVAAFAAIVGVGLLVSNGGLRPPSVGDLLVISAAVVRAVHVTASAGLLRSDSAGSLGVVLVQMTVCATVFGVGAGDALPAAVMQLTLRAWFDVLFLGLLCSVFAFVVQLWAVRRTSASRASILMGTEPVWALLIGVALAGESIGGAGIAGAALVVAASYAGQGIERRHRRSRTPRLDRSVGARTGMTGEL